jgi:hypothetical protein
LFPAGMFLIIDLFWYLKNRLLGKVIVGGYFGLGFMPYS